MNDLRAEMDRFLLWLTGQMELVYADPSCVPGSTFDEKVHHMVRPHIPDFLDVVVKSRFDITWGRKYSISLVVKRI